MRALILKQFTVPDPVPDGCPLKPGLYEKGERDITQAGGAYIERVGYGVILREAD